MQPPERGSLCSSPSHCPLPQACPLWGPGRGLTLCQAQVTWGAGGQCHQPCFPDGTQRGRGTGQGASLPRAGGWETLEPRLESRAGWLCRVLSSRAPAPCPSVGEGQGAWPPDSQGVTLQASHQATRGHDPTATPLNMTQKLFSGCVHMCVARAILEACRNGLLAPSQPTLGDLGSSCPCRGPQLLTCDVGCGGGTSLRSDRWDEGRVPFLGQMRNQSLVSVPPPPARPGRGAASRDSEQICLAAPGRDRSRNSVPVGAQPENSILLRLCLKSSCAMGILLLFWDIDLCSSKTPLSSCARSVKRRIRTGV